MTHNTEDLRTYLQELEKAHATLTISKEVDVINEVPALCSETNRPIICENIKKYEGWKLVDCLVRNRELQSLALKCNQDEVIPHYARLSARGPGKTCILDDGPVKDLIWTGKDASLYRLPVPVPSEGIEVPHLNLKPEDFQTPVISGSIAITKDPDTSVHNCFFTMAKICNEKRAHCYIFSPHTWENIRKYKEKGERAPMALVLGCHPIYELAAVYTGPHPGYSELELAAGMLDEPIGLVNCETVELQVPAYAEIVIEGFIDPIVEEYIHTSAHTDTHCPIISKEPFFDVTAITLRKDPIYRHIQPTRFTDHHALCEFIVSPILFNILKSKGFDVHDIAMPLHSCLNCVVIQMTPRVTEETREALLTAMSMPFFPRMAVAVDKDINIYDVNDLIYALSIRVNPSSDILTIEGVRSFNLEPVAVPIPGMEDNLLRSGSRCGLDATKPPLSQADKRACFERLRAKGESGVFLKDFTSK